MKRIHPNLCHSGLQAFLAMALVVASFRAVAQEPPAPARSEPAAGSKPVVKEVAPGIFEVGNVSLDKKLRTVTFPATLNMNEGLIEYLIVTSHGKTHESLLRTDIEPYHLQVALLLLGARGAPNRLLTNAPSGGPISAGQLAHMEEVKGDPVTIEVSWMRDGVRKKNRIEDLVLNLRTKAPMTRGDFIFNGSRIWEGTFVAQGEGSIVSTITDPDAMINNPRPGHEDDEIWQIIPKGLPALKTPVTVTLILSPVKPKR